MREGAPAPQPDPGTSDSLPLGARARAEPADDAPHPEPPATHQLDDTLARGPARAPSRADAQGGAPKRAERTTPDRADVASADRGGATATDLGQSLAGVRPWDVGGEQEARAAATPGSGAEQDVDAPGAVAGAGPTYARSRRPRAAGGPGRPRVTRARVAALVALLAAAAMVWFLVSLFQPFSGAGSGRVIVSIPKGASASKIGSILARDGVVSSGFFFDVRALLDGKRSSLHSGRFALRRGMSYSAAIDALSKPPPRAIALKVVIPEGYTRRQIADLVHEDALSGDYLSQTKRSNRLDPARYGAPARTRDLEGFLFPATYVLTAGAPVKRLVDEQLAAFRARFSSADRRRARALGVSPYQLLTVASMIEREAQTDHDRPLIAAVIYNRLREGIPLGIDATLYYAVELQKGIATYTGELTRSQLEIDSPYNTRTHKGLPPTPIANPGEASIRAAAHPARVHYLYYVAAADGCGEQAFSDTYAQFERNAAAYQAAVKKNSGHPPACKKK
jgi:UPF0755 protein